MSHPPQSPDPLSDLQRLTESSVQTALQTDAELLTLFVESGHRPAIEALIHRYAGLVASVCRRTVSDPLSAEDAFQATFLVLLKSAKKIQNRRSVAAWLHGVAYRTACRIRKQQLARISEQSLDEVIAPQTAEADPLIVLARKLELEALDQELEKLSPVLQEILVEHYLLGYTARQIAVRTALSVSAVEGRIRRGRYTLLRQLAKRGISLTVLVAASSWFQQQLQAAEADAWSKTFLDSYLTDASNPPDVEPNSDVLSLMDGELKMLNMTIQKGMLSIGATLLVGGLISFNLYGGGQAGRTAVDPATQGFALQTLPEEMTSVVAQFGDSSPARTGPNTGQPSAGQSRQSSGGQSSAGQSAAGQSLNGAAGLTPSGAGILPQNDSATVARADATAAKQLPGMGMSAGSQVIRAEPHDGKHESGVPIPWQVAEGEPPAWLQAGDVALEESAREREEQVRTKLRQPMHTNLKATPLRQALQHVEEMTGLTVLIDKGELESEGVDLDIPITVVGDMSVRECLRRIFKCIDVANAKLAYTVHEDSIEITSKSAANADPAIRYYDLAYVLPNDSHLDSVMSAIQQTVSPEAWLQAGGTHSISPVGSMLIIACDEPAHEKIEVMLARIAAINKTNLLKESMRPQVVAPGGLPGGMGGSLGGGMGGVGSGGMY